MKPGTSARGGGFASAVLTLAATLMLVANQPHGSQVQAPAASGPPQIPTKCQLFWATDRSTGIYRGRGVEGPRIINLYRNKHYKDFDLLKGAMVGGLENTNPDLKSEAYPMLGPKQKGCIYFRRYQITPTEIHDSAWFYPYNSDQAIPLGQDDHAVIYCEGHHSKNPVRKPVWDTIPVSGMCEKYHVSVRGVSLTVPAVPGLTWATQEAAFRTALKGKILAEAMVEEIVRAIAQAAAWYPCNTSGCCRGT